MIIQGNPAPLEITPDIMAGLKAQYPQVDVEAELARMHWWLVRNPARTPRTPARFISNWLGKVRPKPPAKLHLVGSKMTEQEMLATGLKVGIEPAAGESWSQFGRRLQERISCNDKR